MDTLRVVINKVTNLPDITLPRLQKQQRLRWASSFIDEEKMRTSP
jgi:hypothetical protein